ncbi:Lactate dehydrogenase and related dehydrogenase [Rubrobacter radiotolerans]|uniref:Lactate dehydrogenase and related dehydrogenase n=1 Tax=Rubrobacter radiotolerans TaxID=42256 RepID=A0A023X5M1_RUBRA|nr:NAD(P)-dependent oxidoreductase [Rubrobacter radiotolerans]AHY47772.1 Lactate dehydrogenase and related dehydrogenase [Rubrobacter radiotolerans]MDX5892411.1 NAD(P)-dependent oxidoreductase [Rubrobacter radiotolerans]
MSEIGTDERPVRALATEIGGWEAEYLLEALEGVAELETTEETLAHVAPERLGRVEVLMPFIHSAVGPEQFEAMPELRLVATRSTGFDHVDLDTAKERGVAVANVPAYGENTVAEHTFALVLSLSRKVHQAWVRTQRGDYSLEGLRGFDLYGKTFGVVGAGAIGLHAIRIAKGFGMNVLAFDVKQNQLLADVLGFSYASMDELLAGSDIVSLHAPANPATYHLIDREALSKMKRGSLLINTSRGSLVDTAAVEWALDEGILAGVGLDVLEGEEFLANEDELLVQPGAEEKLRIILRNHALQRRQNVVITPHVAFNSEEALKRILDVSARNVTSFLFGEPQNIVGSTAGK